MALRQLGQRARGTSPLAPPAAPAATNSTPGPTQPLIPYLVPTMSATPSPLAQLAALILADFESEALDYDDPKWDEYDFDLFEQACMSLGIA